MSEDVLMKYDVMEAMLDSGTDIALQALLDTERADELDDVVTFLRRHERDADVLGIQTPPLREIIEALERGDHRS